MPGPSPFDALVFDLGGVLVAHDNARLYERLASRCRVRSPARVEAIASHPSWGEGAAVADLHARRGGLGAFERFLSHEMRLSKPGVESFRLVAREAGIAPARSVFFDDLPANVEGARRAGFQAEVFAGEAGLRRHLARAGLVLPP